MPIRTGRVLQQRRRETVRRYAQTALDSGLAYVQSHRQQLRANSPSQELVLPGDGLVTAPAQASVSLRSQGGTSIRVHAAVTMGSIRADEETVVPIGKGL